MTTALQPVEVLLPDHQAPTLERLAMGFLIRYENRNTRQAYERDLRLFFDWYWLRSERSPLEATRDQIQVYARFLEEARGNSASTVARKLSALKGFYTYCEEEGVIDKNPLRFVRRPRVPDVSPANGLDLDEAKRFLEVCEEAAPRDHLLGCLLLYNGLRVSEVTAARVEDLDEHRGHRTLKIRRKGSKIRVVPLASRTTRALEAHLDERGHPKQGPLVPSRWPAPYHDDIGERHLGRSGVREIVRRHAKTAGITKRISPHSFRHTAITLLLDATNGNVRKAQRFADHASVLTTMRYDRAREDLDNHSVYELAEFIEAFEEVESA